MSSLIRWYAAHRSLQTTRRHRCGHGLYKATDLGRARWGVPDTGQAALHRRQFVGDPHYEDAENQEDGQEEEIVAAEQNSLSQIELQQTQRHLSQRLPLT